MKNKYIFVEFFPGDEGDIAAEDYIKENKLKKACYEWDNYKKGYNLYIEK